MILQAIELSGVGRFRERQRIGPFAPGLNVLAAPNEAGKSTLLQAAARALFDRHSSTAAELKSLQPAGTKLAPFVAVEFAARDVRFRLEKTFLQSASSVLQRWEEGAWKPFAEADAADQHVQVLLQSTLPGRGVTKPEHWGMFGFLWARQGEPTEWPGWDDASVGPRIRQKLARVELDPLIDRLRSRLLAAADALTTSTGKARGNGALDVAERDLASLEAGLETLRQTRLELDAAHRAFQESETTVARLEVEHAEREQKHAVLRQDALKAEGLRGELTARELALAAARERLDAVQADATRAALLREVTAAEQAALAAAETEAQAAEAGLAQLRTRLDALQVEHLRADEALRAQRTESQRLRDLLKMRRLQTEAGGLTQQALRAKAAADDLAALEARRAVLPKLTTAKVARLESAVENVRNLRAQIQALGLTVQLTPERDAVIAVQEGAERPQSRIGAGETLSLHRPQALELQLEGWGRLVLRSGAQEAAQTATQLATEEAALRGELESMGVASVEAARQALGEGGEIDALIRGAKASLKPQLGEHASLEVLREAAAGAVRRAETQRALLEPTAAEDAVSQTDLESGEARLATAVPAAEKALQALGRQLDQLRAAERAAVQAAQAKLHSAHEHRTRLRTAETQWAEIDTRHPQGIAESKTAAQSAFHQAEARVLGTQSELPPDFARLPERIRRDAAALAQIEADLRRWRSQRDQARGTLEALGGQGLYARETELEERKVEATLRRDAARAQASSARLLHDLIDRRQQAATRTVLAPLEQRLTAAFSELTGESGRQVFLDERLQIAGIGQVRDEVHAFPLLSQGAKEQLLLCLRLAVAQELATEEPQVLILDDVLVNTDALRQERILDVLGRLAGSLQILILTCHPEQYRGAGHWLELKAGS